MQYNAFCFRRRHICVCFWYWVFFNWTTLGKSVVKIIEQHDVTVTDSLRIDAKEARRVCILKTYKIFSLLQCTLHSFVLDMVYRRIITVVAV